MSHPKNATLITGANGYLGQLVTRLLLETSSRPLLLLLRAADNADLEKKVSGVKQSLALGEEQEKRIQFIVGDIEADDCFDAIDPTTVVRIVHSAAVTRFNVEEDLANSVNFEGTKRVMSFARKCNNLERFCHVSTIYSSGMKPGIVDEEPVREDAGFANFYEQSKWRAESELTKHGSDIPWSIVRVATILADDKHGHVTQQNAVHNTLKLLYYGLLSVIPGNTQTPLYLITGDFAAKAVIAVLDKAEAGKIYNASYRRDECTTLGDFVDNAFATFGNDPSFKKRRIMKPLYSDLDSFSILSQAVTGFGDGIMKQAVSSVSPFAQQLFIDKDVCNSRLRSVLADYHAPDAVEMVRKTCEYLVETKWGRAEAVVGS